MPKTLKLSILAKNDLKWTQFCHTRTGPNISLRKPEISGTLLENFRNFREATSGDFLWRFHLVPDPEKIFQHWAKVLSIIHQQTHIIELYIACGFLPVSFLRKYMKSALRNKSIKTFHSLHCEPCQLQNNLIGLDEGTTSLQAPEAQKAVLSRKIWIVRLINRNSNQISNRRKFGRPSNRRRF